MDLKNLITFIQVAELSSFSHAGEKLGYSQPTISVQIKQLEKELGVPLFERIGHTVRLTDKGREILPHAQRILQLCQTIQLGSDPQSEVQGTVRMGMADSLCTSLFGKNFAALRQRYPKISLNILTASTNELFRLLDHNEVDMVCTLDSHIYNTNYIIASEERVGVHFVTGAGSVLARKTTLTKEDLLKQTFLLTEKGMSYRRLLDEWMAQDSMEIQPVLEIGSADLICDFVADGIGMSFLPDYVTQRAVQNGSVILLDAENFAPSLWKQLLYHRDKWVSPQMQAVIAHFR